MFGTTTGVGAACEPEKKKSPKKRKKSWESKDFGRPKNALLKWEIWPKMKGLHLSEMKGDGPCLNHNFGAFISIHGKFRMTPRPTIVWKQQTVFKPYRISWQGGQVWQGGHRWHSFPWWSCKLTFSWPPLWDLMAHAEDTSFLFSFHIPSFLEETSKKFQTNLQQKMWSVQFLEEFGLDVVDLLFLLDMPQFFWWKTWSEAISEVPYTWWKHAFLVWSFTPNKHVAGIHVYIYTIYWWYINIH